MAVLPGETLDVRKHIRFCFMHLRMLPHPYQGEDCSRLSLAYFALSSLDLLGALSQITEAERKAWINWIYSQEHPHGGFRGAPTLATPDDTFPEKPHLVMTYTALLSLIILEDDLSRVDRKKLQSFVQTCQLQDGCFAPYPDSDERDVRFVYCASSIFKILTDLGHPDTIFNVSRASAYLKSCQNYDGGFGQEPGLESQGGTTYCAIAALKLMHTLPYVCKSTADRWLAQRLVEVDVSDLEGVHLDSAKEGHGRVLGYQGRPEKIPDTCYCFWVAASMQLIEEDRRKGTMLAKEGDDTKCIVSSHSPYPRTFICLAQARVGGIAKFPQEYPDIYHTYMSLAALALGPLPLSDSNALLPLQDGALSASSSLATLRPDLNVSTAAYNRLKKLK